MILGFPLNPPWLTGILIWNSPVGFLSTSHSVNRSCKRSNKAAVWVSTFFMLSTCDFEVPFKSRRESPSIKSNNIFNSVFPTRVFDTPSVLTYTRQNIAFNWCSISHRKKADRIIVRINWLNLDQWRGNPAPYNGRLIFFSILPEFFLCFQFFDGHFLVRNIMF